MSNRDQKLFNLINYAKARIDPSEYLNFLDKEKDEDHARSNSLHKPRLKNVHEVDPFVGSNFGNSNSYWCLERDTQQEEKTDE